MAGEGPHCGRLVSLSVHGAGDAGIDARPRTPLRVPKPVEVRGLERGRGRFTAIEKHKALHRVHSGRVISARP
jgi:hypothetical protein